MGLNLNYNSRVIMGMMMMMMMMVGVVRISGENITEEKNECADQLMGLIPCLGYVGGSGNAPTPNCCTGLKQVVQKSKKCICILVKDKDEASLHFKINVTRALSLPTVCHSSANVSNCPAILNLAPNSPEAKVFEDFAHGKNNNITTTTTVPTNPATTSTPASSAAAASPDSADHLAVAASLISLSFILKFTYIN